MTILHNTKTKILALSYTSVESYTPRIIKIENVRSFFIKRPSVFKVCILIVQK